MSRDAFVDLCKHPELFYEAMSIYEDSFAAWEREDVQSIKKNITSGAYKIFVYLLDSKIIGFYILDINRALHYTLISFLAIKESQRGEGLGSKLCLHAIENFKKHIPCKYLLIEAQERQAQLYQRLGFETIRLDYRVPSFISSQSISMQLMKLAESDDIDAQSLSDIVEDIFIRGYSLNKNDVRIQEQLLKIRRHTP